MGKTVAYLRASTDKQDLNHQKLVLLEFARKRGVKIDEFVEVTISSRKTSKQRRIDELLQLLNKTDALIVTELSRLGRSTAEVIALVNGVLGTSERKVRLSHRQRLLRRCTSYSWSAIGLRNGRSSPRATVSGIANEYRPNMLMWSWISGESLATSASQTWCPSRRN